METTNTTRDLVPTKIPADHPHYLYLVLGVNKYATPEEITKAYREAAQLHHPDREGGDVETFQKIQHAFKVLSDLKRRTCYDATGASEGLEALATEEARIIVAGRIRTIIQDQAIDLSLVDIVSAIKSGLQSDIALCAQGVKSCNKSIKRLKKGRKRAKAGLVRMVFDENIETLEKAAQQMRDDSGLFSLSLKIVATCGYEFDEPPPPVAPRGHIVVDGDWSHGVHHS